jgi:hypothetical protein
MSRPAFAPMFATPARVVREDACAPASKKIAKTTTA